MSTPFSGILDIDPKGFGFVRSRSAPQKLTNTDPYVPPALITSHNLRPGVLLDGTTSPQKNGKLQVETIGTINGLPRDQWAGLTEFSHHEVISPFEHIRLEARPGKVTDRTGHVSMRIVDLFCPIGKGQRALIVSPPKAGKTMLMQHFAHAISFNNPDMVLLVLLVDERPEEVTDMRRTIKGEVFASSSDSEGGEHTRLARIVLEYAKRKVETGKDVVILLDSLTRVGRAFNIHQRSSGRTMTGGVDIRALEIPKRIFGAARKCEDGGSLTIIATALVDTGSRMDELIFQEFKGTGNMELVLDRELANERIFPSLSISLSGTRREELLFGPFVAAHQALRRSVARLSAKEAMLTVLKLIEKYPTNERLLATFQR